MKSIRIEVIRAEDTLAIRQIAMWADKDIAFVKLKDDLEGQHFGLYRHECLISVISLFSKGDRMQFRKFATRPEYQGRGYGSMLLKEVIERAKTSGFKDLWCNARVSKVSYYEAFGLVMTEETFIKEGQSYVIMTLNLKK